MMVVLVKFRLAVQWKLNETESAEATSSFRANKHFTLVATKANMYGQRASVQVWKRDMKETCGASGV